MYQSPTPNRYKLGLPYGEGLFYCSISLQCAGTGILVDFGIVQPFTALTVRELRQATGLTQGEFAREICASKRSVIYWEQGKHWPDTAHLRQMRMLARRYGLTRRSTGLMPLRYDAEKMKRYLGKPSDAGKHWRTMTLQQRNSWWGHRSRYRKLQADIHAGRILAVPINS